MRVWVFVLLIIIAVLCCAGCQKNPLRKAGAVNRIATDAEPLPPAERVDGEDTKELTADVVGAKAAGESAQKDVRNVLERAEKSGNEIVRKQAEPLTNADAKLTDQHAKLEDAEMRVKQLDAKLVLANKDADAREKMLAAKSAALIEAAKRDAAAYQDNIAAQTKTIEKLTKENAALKDEGLWWFRIIMYAIGGVFSVGGMGLFVASFSYPVLVGLGARVGLPFAVLGFIAITIAASLIEIVFWGRIAMMVSVFSVLVWGFWHFLWTDPKKAAVAP